MLKFYENELRLKFHCYILIPRKCPRKTLFQHTVPPRPLPSTYPPLHVSVVCELPQIVNPQKNLWAQDITVPYFIGCWHPLLTQALIRL